MILRILLGFPFVYFLAGLPLARLFLVEERRISLKLVFTGALFSWLLTYPAAVLTTVIEGQSAAAIYSVHLPKSLFSLGLISLVSLIGIIWKRQNWRRVEWPRIDTGHVVLLLCAICYLLFAICCLGRADVLGDDYDLAYQAYNLHDGIMAARKAYIISFSGHPPLMMTIKHFGMQLFSPWGLETLEPWMFRGVEAVMGLGVILGIFLLARDFVSPRAAIFAVLLAAVNNYLIFFGRYFEREIYLAPFLIGALYFFLWHIKQEKKRDLVLSAIFLGAGFLVKMSAITFLPIPIFFFLWRRNGRMLGLYFLILLLVYLPVVCFNIGAYLTTGYMDTNFSRFFGYPHPLATGVSPDAWCLHPPGIFWLLLDLNSLPVFLAMLAGAGYGVYRGFRGGQGGRGMIFLAGWLVFSLAFFAFAPLRAYYLVFMNVPLLIFLAAMLADLRRAGKIIAVVLICWSVYYAANSNLISHGLGLKYDDIGAGGETALLRENFLGRRFSFAAQAFAPARGWGEIRAKMAKNYDDGTCLEKEGGVNDLALRYYLRTDDGVKAAFLGKDYPREYKMCSEKEGARKKVVIYYDGQGRAAMRVERGDKV